VYDVDPQAPGIILAKKHKIYCSQNTSFPELFSDPEIDVIFEVTGVDQIYRQLREMKRPHTTVIGAASSKIIFHLLDTQYRLNQNLEGYKKNLEKRIVERTEELETANQSLQKKILEYEQLNEKLQQINDEKTKYLLQATHQLKAPFAAIQSYVDIIMDGYTGVITDQTKDIMGKIKQRCKLLASSIKEMLELANLKSFVAENQQKDNIDLNVVLKSVVDTSQVTAQRNKITIEFTPYPKRAIINCITDQIKILFSILLENAIHYSHPGSKVEVFYNELGPKQLQVCVRDYGIGIAQDVVAKIFNEYFRANNAVAKHENGSGLGLAIAKEVAVIHKYSLDVQSQLDQGTTFMLNLTLAD
ncbi:MAG: HAMP domain-containing sensor histidine kinase, partial [Pseudomonadota bacterium]